MNAIPVYLEIGAKRVFAAAVDWPGWCRAGRDEATALEALVAYGPRYARAVASAGLGFRSPASTESLDVVDRVDGDSTTGLRGPRHGPEL